MVHWNDDGAERERLRSDLQKRGSLLGRTLQSVTFWHLDGRVYCDLAVTQLQYSGTLLEFLEHVGQGVLFFDPTDAWNSLTLQES